MPINDPIQRAKVAPASLAFEGRRALSSVMIAEESVPDTVNYQTFITQIVFNPFDALQAKRIAAQEAQRILRNVADSELRSKAAISDWHRAFEWDSYALNSSHAPALPWSSSTTGLVATPLRFNNEVLRSPGVYSPGVALWRFYAPADAVGVYHFDVAAFMRFSPADHIIESRCAVMLNGQLWRHIYMTNATHNDKNYLETTYMQGSVLMPLKAGDYVSFAVYLTDDGHGPGTGTLTATSEYYAYVSDYRVSCEPTTYSPFEYYNSLPTSGAGFDNSN